jgi:hypothetical protein
MTLAALAVLPTNNDRVSVAIVILFLIFTDLDLFGTFCLILIVLQYHTLK